MRGVMTMVSPSDDFRTLATTAADERQIRIAVFKNKVATLRATSRVYNITSERSVNTLESSLASTIASSRHASCSGADDGSATGVATALPGTGNLAALRAPVKRSPEEDKSLFAYDGGSKNRASVASRVVETGAGGHVTLTYQRATNPFVDSDSEVSSGEDAVTVDSSVEDDDSKSTDSDIFAHMLNAFRKIPSVQAPMPNEEKGKEEEGSGGEEGKQDEESAPEKNDGSKSTKGDISAGMITAFRMVPDAGVPTLEEKEQEDAPGIIDAKTVEPLSLEEKFGATGRGGVAAAGERPGVMANQATSYSNKQSNSVVSGTSFDTFSTFSIESVQASGSKSWGSAMPEIADQVRPTSALSSEKIRATPLLMKSVTQQSSPPLDGEKLKSNDDENNGNNSMTESQENFAVICSSSKVAENAKNLSSSSSFLLPSGSSSNPFEGDDPREDVTNGITKITYPLVKEWQPLQPKDDSNNLFTMEPAPDKKDKRVEKESTSPGLMRKRQSKPLSRVELNNPFEASPIQRTDEEQVSHEVNKQPSRAMELASWWARRSSTPASTDVVDKADASTSTIHQLHLSSVGSTEAGSAKKNPPSRWTSGVNSVASNQSDHESPSSMVTDAFLHDFDFMSASTASTASTSKNKASMSPANPPFVQQLALRHARKVEKNRWLTKSMGSVNLGSSSSQGASMSSNSHSRSAGSVRKGKDKRIFFCEDDSNNDSLDGLLFSDLKKALSKIQSVDYEESAEEDKKNDHSRGDKERAHDDAWLNEQDDLEDEGRLPDIQSLIRSESSTPRGAKWGKPSSRLLSERLSQPPLSASSSNNKLKNLHVNDDESGGRPSDIQSQLVIKKESESSGVSSLKDASNFDIENESKTWDNPFKEDSDSDEDDNTTVVSVPKSPTPIEGSEQGSFRRAVHRFRQIHLVAQDNHSDTSLDDNSIMRKDRDVEDWAIAKPNNVITNPEPSAAADDSVITVTCSNSQNIKTDRLQKHDKDREETTLTPPKNSVVISDGSMSTKDSILGKTINVANADLVAERIYLESLRAQVLAELKVHIADEEIRLALNARLHAIQDYYKRKATVLHLKPTVVPPAKSMTDASAAGSTLLYNSHTNLLKRLGELPKVKPVAVAQSTSLEDVSPWTPESLLSSFNPYPHQHQNSPKLALERTQDKVNEAARAVHNSDPSLMKHTSSQKQSQKANSVGSPVGVEEKVAGEGDDYNCQLTETPIPLHIFTKDTFWEDEDSPSHFVSSTPGGAGGLERVLPLSHADTIQNAWSFYRNINTLIFDSRAYDYEFNLIRDDPLYPYLDSLVGIADGGDDGHAGEYKRISQRLKREYADKSPHRICHSLSREAEHTLPGLKAICAYIGNRLGMHTMAVGPTKKPSEALLKCERKYGGDPLLVTDYCRTSLFVKDVATLLALIEIVLSKYASTVRRIKLSSLKSNMHPLVGGYRDAKINLDLNGHICEIQVHLIPLWLIKEGRGYAHYKECCEHHVDVSSFDIRKTLNGLESETLTDLIKMGEGLLTRRTPIVSLRQYHEEQIRDYFALANLYMYCGLPEKAEHILRRTVRLRSESDDFGPCHAETLLHMELLRVSLKCQHKHTSASSIKNQICKARKIQHPQDHSIADEPNLSEMCASGDQCGAIDYVCDMILDPSKRERVEEKRRAVSVEESRALWLRVRKTFFS